MLEGAGPVGGCAIVMQDATERREIAVVLEESRQERTRLQEKLLSHVSHELRTPLTAIYLFTTNVLDGLLGDLNPEQREHLTFALDNVKQLKSMVSDLLEITRVETHKLTVEPQHVNPVKLIAEVLGTCLTNAAVKKVNLRSDVAPSLPFIWADPARVRQILTNQVYARRWNRYGREPAPRGKRRLSHSIDLRYGMRNRPGKSGHHLRPSGSNRKRHRSKS